MRMRHNVLELLFELQKGLLNWRMPKPSMDFKHFFVSCGFAILQHNALLHFVLGGLLHPSLKHDDTPWVDAQEGRQCILSFVTSTSKLAPASVISHKQILRSWTLTMPNLFTKFSYKLIFCVSLDLFLCLWPLQTKWHQPLSYPMDRFIDLSSENPY